MKTISFKLSPGLYAKLAATSRQKKRTKSEIMREALETYFANGGLPKGLSCYDLAPDLAGCVDSGIPDLASNPKHMEGFGRE